MKMTKRTVGIDLTKNDHSDLDALINIGLRYPDYDYVFYDPNMQNDAVLYEKISMLRELQRSVQIISHIENADKDTWWVGN